MEISMHKILLMFIAFFLFSSPCKASEDVKDLLFGLGGKVLDQVIVNQNKKAARERIEQYADEDKARREADERQRKQREIEQIERQRRYQEAEERERALEKEEAQQKALQDLVIHEEYVSGRIPKPCLSNVCIGMTLPELLEANIEYIDGAEYRREAQLKEAENIGNAHNLGFFEKLKLNFLIKESLRKEDNKNYKRAAIFRGVSKTERRYISKYLGTFFDKKALHIYLRASPVCDYEELKVRFLSDNGDPTTIYFDTSNDDMIPRVILIEREYSYEKDVQIEQLKDIITNEYQSFNVSAYFICSGNCSKDEARFKDSVDILYQDGMGWQKLTLIDRRLSYLAAFNNENDLLDMLRSGTIHNPEFINRYQSQEGCTTTPSL